MNHVPHKSQVGLKALTLSIENSLHGPVDLVLIPQAMTKSPNTSQATKEKQHQCTERMNQFLSVSNTFKMKQRNYSHWWRLVANPANHDELPQLNYRGLGQPRAILELMEMVKKYSSSIIFLIETRSKEGFLKKLCSKLQTDNVFIVPRTNTGGGLALYWRNSIDLNVVDSSPTYIDVVVNPGVDVA